MATAAGAGGDVHRVLYDAVALCSASCAQRTTTNPTMKGAATPVTVGLDQAPQPHLTRLPIVSASASPTLSDHCTISWPPLTACSHLTRTYAATLGTGVFGARRNHAPPGWFFASLTHREGCHGRAAKNRGVWVF